MTEKKPNKQEQKNLKGGTKSSRRSSTTIANKERRENTRALKFARATERRHKAGGKKAQRDRRTEQQARIAKKQAQRQAFAKLSPKEKAEHREAGKRQFANA